MVVRYNNGTTKVFSRYPNNEKISLENKELGEFEKIVGNNNNLKNVFYDVKIKNIREQYHSDKNYTYCGLIADLGLI